MLGNKRAETPKCASCGKSVYPMELISAMEKSFHKGCFKCATCNITLTLKNFKTGVVNGDSKAFCQVHAPTAKPSQVASRELVSQMSAPKLNKSPGIQKNVRMTFQATDYDVQTAPTWGVKPSPTASPQKAPYRGSAPVDSAQSSPSKSFGSRSSTVSNGNTKENEKPRESTTQEKTSQTSSASNTSASNNSVVSSQKPTKNLEKGSVHKIFQDISKQIAFLQGEENEMTVFWSMFANSISESQISGRVSISADASESRFEVFSSNMNDSVSQFLTSVGAPSEEIEVMTQLENSWNNGSGYWVEMSSRNGMDGGYLLPSTSTSSETIQNSIEEGYMTKSIFDWIKNSGSTVTHVTRDAGQTPPRPVEIAVKITEQSGKPALSVAMNAWRNFSIPELPDETLQIIKQHAESSPNADYVARLCFIPEGLVRLSIAISNPSKQTLDDAIAMGQGDASKIAQIVNVVGRQPDFIEYSYLTDGFGYQVYKEGASVRIQYHFT